MHTIPLRGNWTAAPLPDGRTRHARRFGAPRLPDPAERVWVTGTAPGPAAVSVNGLALGEVAAGTPFAFDITPLLAPRNELTLDATDPAPPDGVAVEIRRPCG